MPRLSLGPLLLALMACNGHAGAPDPTPTEPTVTEPAYDPGPELTPSADLVAWFEGEGAGKLVQLPVVVTPNVLGVSKGTLHAEDDALELKLDDGGMSVGLADRLRDVCEMDKPCAVWLEGVWGPTVAMPAMPAFGPQKETFSVRRLVGKVQDGDEARVRIPRQ